MKRCCYTCKHSHVDEWEVAKGALIYHCQYCNPLSEDYPKWEKETNLWKRIKILFGL